MGGAHLHCEGLLSEAYLCVNTLEGVGTCQCAVGGGGCRSHVQCCAAIAWFEAWVVTVAASLPPPFFQQLPKEVGGWADPCDPTTPVGELPPVCLSGVGGSHLEGGWVGDFSSPLPGCGEVDYRRTMAGKSRPTTVTEVVPVTPSLEVKHK